MKNDEGPFNILAGTVADKKLETLFLIKSFVEHN